MPSYIHFRFDVVGYSLVSAFDVFFVFTQITLQSFAIVFRRSIPGSERISSAVLLLHFSFVVVC